MNPESSLQSDITSPPFVWLNTVPLYLLHKAHLHPELTGLSVRERHVDGL